ncbi:MAG: DUF5808 domain-containing protein [Alphaproteobacteria bacterium]
MSRYRMTVLRILKPSSDSFLWCINRFYIFLSVIIKRYILYSINGKNLSHQEIEALWSDPDNWKWHSIYSCKEDPRVCVPKRVKWTGWTVNFAHPRAWPFLFLVILIGLAPILLYCVNGTKEPIVFLQIISVTIMVLLFIGWHFSKTR